MQTAFEVGAVFRIINRASPTLTAILRQVRALNEIVEKTRLNLAGLGKDLSLPSGSLSAAIGETRELGAAWKGVAKSAADARAAIGAASATSARSGATAAIGRGGGGRHQPPWLRGHVQGPGIPMPGGGHVRFGGAIGAGVGLLAYGVDMAMKYDDASVLMAQHAGTDWAANRDKYKQILMDASKSTGYGEADVSAATQQELRMLRDTPGGGVDILPQMIRYAATEARLKGTSLTEAMGAEVGLAHMLQRYSGADIEKLAPAFSALSLRNPMTLAQQERAFGYAVPLLHSAMGLDPFQVMSASTALARAGINSSKAGTWVRSMMMGAMPGTSLITKMRFNKHEAALKELGLVDDAGKPTWFVDGKPNEMQFLDTVAQNLPKIPVDQRAGVLQGLAGVRGAGALAILAEPAVRQQMQEIYADTQNPSEVNRVRNFMSVYGDQSALQNARTTLQTFNTTMADIGEKILPGVNHGLADFKGILGGISSILPKVPNAGGTVGARVLEFGGIGAAGGAVVGGPAGALVGGVGGGIVGGAEGVAETYMKSKAATDLFSGAVNAGKSFGDSVVNSAEKFGNAAASAFRHYLESLPSVAVPGPTPGSPIHLSLNLDSRVLAETMSTAIANAGIFTVTGPTSNDSGRWAGGDDFSSDI